MKPSQDEARKQLIRDAITVFMLREGRSGFSSEMDMGEHKIPMLGCNLRDPPGQRAKLRKDIAEYCDGMIRGMAEVIEERLERKR